MLDLYKGKTMKITFKPLSYQKDAVKAVIDVFSGQQDNQGLIDYTIDQGIKPIPNKSVQIGLDLSDEKIENNRDDSDAMIGFANTALFNEKSEFLRNIQKEQILKNIQTVQINQGLPKSDTLVTADIIKRNVDISLTGSPLNLNIEMETGTGKTYTYLRTMFELNKK